MYGVRQLQFDSSYPDPSCDACNKKHLSLFFLGEYCKVYDNKTCCFSDLAKDQIHICKECICALRKAKDFQLRCFGAQKIMQSYYNLVYPDFEQLPQQRSSHQETHGQPSAEPVRRENTQQLVDSTTTLPPAGDV